MSWTSAAAQFQSTESQRVKLIIFVHTVLARHYRRPLVISTLRSSDTFRANQNKRENRKVMWI